MIDMNGLKRPLLLLIFLLLPASFAWSSVEEAEAAVSEVLFEMEEIEPDGVVYEVSGDGHVDLYFTDGTPKEVYQAVIIRLRKYPGVTGVWATFASGSTCVMPD